MADVKTAYTTQELIDILCLAKSNVLLRAARENWQSIPRPGRGGGNLWLINSMPEHTRASITLAIAKQMEQVPALISRQSDIVVPDYAWTRGKARYRVVCEWQAAVKQAKTKGIGAREATKTFIAAVKSGLLLPVETVKAAGGISLPTLYRWRDALLANGQDIEALADKRGGWLNGQKKGLGQIDEQAEQAFLSVYLKPNQPSVQYAYNAMELVLAKQQVPVPSYSTVRRFIQRFDSVHHDLVVLMREGEKAYIDKVGSYLSRDDSVLEVGDVLIADGHKLNFLVKNPETGKPCRMTLIGWQDWKSRMFVGFEIMVNENTQAISASLFRSIINLGKLPKATYIDNGKAFKNKFFDGDVDLEDFDGLYARLGIYVQHSMPYCARTKIIERWWGDFDRQCEVGLASYTGASIEGKPAHMQRNEIWHKAQHEKSGANVPTVEDVIRIVTEYARWKAFQPHPTMPGTTPYALFMAGRGEGYPVEEVEALSRQFLHRKPIHPSRCRFVLHGIEFESDVLHGINKELTVHYAYSDLSEVYVYDAGRLLCTARPVATVNPLAAVFGDALDMEKVKAGQKQVAALRRETRRQASALVAWGASSEALTALPWMQPASERKQALTLRKGGVSVEQIALPTPIMTEAQVSELAEYAKAIQSQHASVPSYEVPSFFCSQSEKYEYLFDLSVCQGVRLSGEHQDFMAQYEQTDAYQGAARRYEKLRTLFSVQEATA